MISAILTSVLFLTAMCVVFSVALVIAEKKILNYGTCKIDINDGEKVHEVAGGSSLLSSLAENNIFIPSACGGRGTCAYCKVKVHEGGGAMGPVEEPNLTPEEIKANVRLACQVKVRNDIKISVPKELFSVRKFRAKVAGKKPLTHDIVELRMELIDPPEITFVSGQYVQLQSDEYKGRDSVMRAYSISSVPSDKNAVELNVRLVPNGICTTWVFDHVEVGKEVTLSGPFGEFGLSDTDAPIICIAGGSGMAPIWSIVRDMKERGIARETTYFFGAITQRDLFYVDELRALEKELPWFTYVPALSGEPEDSGWDGERGLITDVVSRHFPDTSKHEAYLCGSPGMINASMKVLTGGGMTEDNVYFDKFA